MRQKIFNGTGYVEAQINPYSERVSLNDMTNGMQYRPSIDDGSLNAYDNNLQRNIKYKYDSDQSLGAGDNKISAKKYTEDTFNNVDVHYLPGISGTINVSPAFNLNMMMSK